MKIVFEGIGFILIGVVIVYITYKYPIKNNAALPTLSGYIGGFGAIIIGAMILLGKLPPL